VLIDESGFFLNPLVRRSWAPVGQTPVLEVWGRHRDKVLSIAALTVSPRAKRLGLYFATDPERYYNAQGVAGFLRQLLRHLRSKVIVVWDNGPNHKGPAIRELLRRRQQIGTATGHDPQRAAAQGGGHRRDARPDRVAALPTTSRFFSPLSAGNNVV